MAKVAVPDSDPFYGPGGPLLLREAGHERLNRSGAVHLRGVGRLHGFLALCFHRHSGFVPTVLGSGACRARILQYLTLLY